MKDPLRLRFRIDFSSLCSIGPGKIQLLEAIDEHGSLSGAAREIGMSYRRAWLLVDSMNNSFDKPVVSTSSGGNGGGGATITSFGRELMDAYRKLEKKLADVTESHMLKIQKHVRGNIRKVEPSVSRHSLIRNVRSAAAAKRIRKRSAL